MKIIHLCLSNFYIDGMSYQENELIREHVKDGHEVLVIASTENQGKDKKICYVAPGGYMGQESAKVIRLAYVGFPHAIAKKLRKHRGVYKLIEDFKPDVMLFHSMCGPEILTVAKYKKNNPNVKFYADCHEDRHNSAKGFVSKEILHKLYYAPMARSAAPYIEKILCVNIASMEFMRDVYKIDEEKLEFFPLAGTPLTASTIAKKSAQARKELSLLKRHIILVQSGKQTRRKKLIESLQAFSKIDNQDMKFLIVGQLFKDIEQEAKALIAADDRIVFLGWKTAEQLTDILCAADIYLQPGTQSSTMQHSLCCGCAIIIDDVPSHAPYYVDNGWLINSKNSLEFIFEEIEKSTNYIKKMGKNSNRYAHKMLNYAVHAKRILK